MPQADCCDITFSRSTAPQSMDFEGVHIGRGQDVWVADQETKDGQGQCIRLIGIRAVNPGTGKDSIRICNCTGLCWVEGKRATDPGSGRDKFTARISIDQPPPCACRVVITIDPCCGPTLFVPPDNNGVIRYDTCAPPTLADDSIGLCYAPGSQFLTTFPSSISCDGVTLLFQRAVVRLCGGATTLEFTTGTVHFTLPSAGECSVNCRADIVAIYRAEGCCELAFDITHHVGHHVPQPCEMPWVEITTDCRGHSGVPAKLISEWPHHGSVCYSEGTEVRMIFPAILECFGGARAYFDHATLELWEGSVREFSSNEVTFIVSVDFLSPAEGHYHPILKAYYVVDCCACNVIVRTEPCCGPVVRITPDCDGDNEYDTCNPPTYGDANTVGVCYRYGQGTTIFYPNTIECAGETLDFIRAEACLCNGETVPYTVTEVTVIMPPETACPSACDNVVTAYYAQTACRCRLDLSIEPCHGNAKARVTPDCEGFVSYNLATGSPELRYHPGTTVSVTLPSTIECDGVQMLFRYANIDSCTGTQGRAYQRTFGVIMPLDGQCEECWASVVGYYTEACVNGTCEDLDRAIGGIRYAVGGVNWTEEGSASGCHSTCTACMQEALDLKPVLEELNAEFYRQGACWWRFNLNQENPFCHQQDECRMRTKLHVDFDFRFTFSWDCVTGIARVGATLGVQTFGIRVIIPMACSPCRCAAPNARQDAWVYPMIELPERYSNIEEAVCAGVRRIRTWWWSGMTIQGDLKIAACGCSGEENCE